MYLWPFKTMAMFQAQRVLVDIVRLCFGVKSPMTTSWTSLRRSVNIFGI